MSELITVAGVSYIGLCVGTYISVSNLDDGILSKLSIAVFAPIPVFMLLVWIATSIAFERFKTIKDFCGYPLLLVLSLSMYADAISILFCKSINRGDNKSTHITEYRYKVPMIKNFVVTNYVTA